MPTAIYRARRQSVPHWASRGSRVRPGNASSVGNRSADPNESLRMGLTVG